MRFPFARFAALALLVMGSGALLGVVLRGTPAAAHGEALSADALPWDALVLDGATPPARGGPGALLYVQRRCSHCAATAYRFDSIVAHTGISGFIVTNDSATAAREYARELGLRRAIAVDTGSLMLRALGVRFVPTLVVFDAKGNASTSLGSRSAAELARLLGVRE